MFNKPSVIIYITLKLFRTCCTINYIRDNELLYITVKRVVCVLWEIYDLIG